jgi:hypothetical protein
MKTQRGATKQSGMTANASDYNHQQMHFPVLGIVINVYAADDPLNKSSVPKQDQRGTQIECNVLVVNDGRSTSWILPNVVVLSHAPTGVDNFHEELPRPCTMMLDGTEFSTDLRGIDMTKLDGDWVVVGFIGGSINQPYVIGWWPHPSNRRDSATGNISGLGNLRQGRRSLRRINGASLTVTDKGSVYVDTNEAGASLVPGPVVTKKTPDPGGDIKVSVKKSRTFELNWNPTVAQPELEPSLPQANPPQGTFIREDVVTRITADKDLVEMIAGSVLKLMARSENLEMIAAKVASLVCENVDFQASQEVRIKAVATAVLEGLTVQLGGDGLIPAIDGVVRGECVDPLTGIPHFALGGVSTKVMAKKE